MLIYSAFQRSRVVVEVLSGTEHSLKSRHSYDSEARSVLRSLYTKGGPTAIPIEASVLMNDMMDV